MDGNKKARMKRAQRMALRNGRQDRVFNGTYEEVNHADMDAGALLGTEPDGAMGEQTVAGR